MARLYLDADMDHRLGRALTVAGHDVLTTSAVGRRRAGDEEQLAYAAALGRILVTHNRDDFRLLQRAWRHGADVWSVQPRPNHAGILSVPQPPVVRLDRLALEIDAFVRSSAALTNRFHEWTAARGWVPYG